MSEINAPTRLVKNWLLNGDELQARSMVVVSHGGALSLKTNVTTALQWRMAKFNTGFEETNKEVNTGLRGIAEDLLEYALHEVDWEYLAQVLKDQER